jgi:hypothetical protein
VFAPSAADDEHPQGSHVCRINDWV